MQQRVKKTQKKVKKAKKKRNPSRAQVEKHLQVLCHIKSCLSDVRVMMMDSLSQLDNRLTEDTDMMRSTCVEGLRKV